MGDNDSCYGEDVVISEDEPPFSSVVPPMNLYREERYRDRESKEIKSKKISEHFTPVAVTSPA